MKVEMIIRVDGPDDELIQALVNAMKNVYVVHGNNLPSYIDMSMEITISTSIESERRHV